MKGQIAFSLTEYLCLSNRSISYLMQAQCQVAFYNYPHIPSFQLFDLTYYQNHQYLFDYHT